MSNPPLPNQTEVDHRKPKSQFPLQVPSDSEKKINFNRSLRRSKANVRRKVMSADLDYMITLTYRENKQDLEAAWIDFTKWIRRVRSSNPTYKYVAVAEFQKRGAVHFHVAVKGWQQITLLRSHWLAVVGDGNVRVDRPKRQVKYKWQLAKIASYMVKYITKDLGAAFGRQRYRVSEGIIIPCHRVLLSFPIGIDWLGEIFDSVGAQLTYRFESDQGWAWACSW